MNISFWATKFQTINEINSYRSQIEGLVPLLEDLYNLHPQIIFELYLKMVVLRRQMFLLLLLEFEIF